MKLYPKSPRSDAELEQLAFDALSGKIFTSFDCDRVEDLRLVFLPLGLMSREQLAAFKEDEPYMFFEYLKNAGPRSINGMPCFFSLQWLNKNEFERFSVRFEEISALLNARREKAQ